MSDRQRKVYQTDGERYETLSSREDYQGNIMLALEKIVRPDELDVLDLGAGTCRLTLMYGAAKKFHDRSGMYGNMVETIVRLG
jgi:hypothetical protein